MRRGAIAVSGSFITGSRLSTSLHQRRLMAGNRHAALRCLLTKVLHLRLLYYFKRFITFNAMVTNRAFQSCMP